MAKALTSASVEKLKADPNKRLEVPDGLMTGLYLIIQPSGARSWAVRYRAGGQPKKLTLGPYPALKLDKAREAARDAILAAQRGADPAAEKADKKRYRRSGEEKDRLGFAAVSRRYLARDAKQNRSWVETARLLGFKPPADGSDDPAHFVVIANGLADRWRQRLITEIRRPEVIENLDIIVDRGAPVVANRTLAALRRLFNWTIERGLLDVTPCSGIKAPAAEISRDRVLNDNELRWAWMASNSLGYPFGPAIKLLLLTAQRREEVGGMSESELEGGLWTIPADRAKNNQQHAVPLSELAQSIVADLPKIRGTRRLLFTTTGSTPVSGWSRAKRQMNMAMLDLAQSETKDPNILIPAWTFHDMRRSVASGMARLGIAVHVVERLLNHRSGTIRGVAAVYNRFDYWEERSAAASAWAKYVAALVGDHDLTNVVRLSVATR